MPHAHWLMLMFPKQHFMIFFLCILAVMIGPWRKFLPWGVCGASKPNWQESQEGESWVVSRDGRPLSLTQPLQLCFLSNLLYVTKTWASYNAMAALNWCHKTKNEKDPKTVKDPTCAISKQALWGYQIWSENYQRIIRQLSENHQRFTRKSSENHQRIIRESSENHQRIIREL